MYVGWCLENSAWFGRQDTVRGYRGKLNGQFGDLSCRTATFLNHKQLHKIYVSSLAEHFLHYLAFGGLRGSMQIPTVTQGRVLVHSLLQCLP